MTHHAAALTYYALMSLFPAVLLALSLLGLLGQYPETYNAILGYLRDVAPASVIDPLDRSLRGALQSKGTAATALVISVVVALYGTTGALEAARRALNVVFEVHSGRSFLGAPAAGVGAPPARGWLGGVVALGAGEELDVGGDDLVLGARRAVVGLPLLVVQATGDRDLAALGEVLRARLGVDCVIGRKRRTVLVEARAAPCEVPISQIGHESGLRGSRMRGGRPVLGADSDAPGGGRLGRRCGRDVVAGVWAVRRAARGWAGSMPYPKREVVEHKRARGWPRERAVGLEDDRREDLDAVHHQRPVPREAQLARLRIDPQSLGALAGHKRRLAIAGTDADHLQRLGDPARDELVLARRVRPFVEADVALAELAVVGPRFLARQGLGEAVRRIAAGGDAAVALAAVPRRAAAAVEANPRSRMLRPRAGRLGLAPALALRRHRPRHSSRRLARLTHQGEQSASENAPGYALGGVRLDERSLRPGIY